MAPPQLSIGSHYKRFAIVVAVLFNVCLSLSANFGVRPLLIFSDDMLPGFVYAVIIVDIVARETLYSSAVVTDTPPNRAPNTCPLSWSENLRISSSASIHSRRTKRVPH